MTVEFRGGRRPADPSKPRLRFRAFAQVPPAVELPDRVDWLTLPSWPMFGNDRFGDCVFADQGHEILSRTVLAGRPAQVTDDQVLAQYARVTGFDPADPASDQGAVMQDALNAWRVTGFGDTGHRILAFAEVDFKDADEVLAAVDLFGALSVGVTITQAAMDQFNAGQPWMPSSRFGKTLGGHAVHAGRVARRAGGGLTIWVVTWGRVQEVSWEWWLTCVDEAWVTITEDWIEASGLAPVGLNRAALAEQFRQLTGEPAPFPDPAPTPGPVPGPDAPTPADLLLSAAIHRWATSPHWFGARAAARRVRAWEKAKGLPPGTP